MAQEQAMPHKLTLNERKMLTMTGVSEVVSFSDDLVVLKTSLGTLTVHGQGMQLKMLSVDGGDMAVEGSINAFVYEQPRQSGGMLRRLFA